MACADLIGESLSTDHPLAVMLAEAAASGGLQGGAKSLGIKDKTSAESGARSVDEAAIAALEKKFAADLANKDLLLINGRKPINSQYAGATHPSGVDFNSQGFPNFSPFAKSEVKISGLTGRYATDARMANEAIGLKSTPEGCK